LLSSAIEQGQQSNHNQILLDAIQSQSNLIAISFDPIQSQSDLIGVNQFICKCFYSLVLWRIVDKFCQVFGIVDACCWSFLLLLCWSNFGE